MPRMREGTCSECKKQNVLLFPTPFHGESCCLNCLPEIQEANERTKRLESSRSVKVRRLEPGEVLQEARVFRPTPSFPDSLHYMRSRFSRTKEPL